MLEAIAVSVENKITVGSECEDGHSSPLSVREGLKVPTKEMRKRGWFERFERRMNKPSRSDVELAHLYIGESLGATPVLHKRTYRLDSRFDEIGSSSCRERVCQYVSLSVVAVSFKKK